MQLVSWIKAQPRSRSSFGLTHADLHLGNLSILREGPQTSVVAFDFDDACEHFFLHDLAVAVASIRKAAWESPGAFDEQGIERGFLAAYTEAAAGFSWQPEDLERFVAYRIALSACWASRSRALGELDEDLTGWFRRSLPWWLSQLARL